MKKGILILGIIFLANIKAFGQDFISGAAIAKELAVLNGQVKILNETSASNKFENLSSKVINKDNLEFVEKVEETYWKVDGYLKRGEEIRNVLNREKEILNKLKDLRSVSGKLSFNNRNEVINATKGVLQTVGNLVDTAIGLVSDNQYRMTTEERRSYLKEIDSGLKSLGNSLDNQIYNVKYFISSVKKSQDNKRDLDSAIRQQKNLRIK